MNILYIGPYKQTDYIGVMSLLHIHSIKQYLSQSDKLITRPIYLDTNFISNLSIDAEHGTANHFDMIIQYLPVDFLAITTNTKNIAIPIFDPKLCRLIDDSKYSVLNLCDKILIDEERYKNILRSYNIQKSIEIYEEHIPENHTQKFDLDPIQDSYKFGFIGKYQSNKQIIQKIILAFLLNYRTNNNTKLYFFLTGNEQDRRDAEDQVAKIKKDLSIPEYIRPIHCLFELWEHKNITIALDSLNCFISLNDDYRYVLYEKFFMSNAIDTKKFLINRQNISIIETPVINISHISEYNNTLSSIYTKDLIDKMKSAPQAQQKNKKNNFNCLGHILCKQAQ